MRGLFASSLGFEKGRDMVSVSCTYDADKVIFALQMYKSQAIESAGINKKN